MKSFTSRRFRDLYAALPDQIRSRARKAYALFRQDPSHLGLNFKQIEPGEGIYSVRVGLGYRALGRRQGDEIVWFCIGPHSEYDKIT